MTQDTGTLPQEAALDLHKLDRLMDLSGELVIVRSQYARLEKLLHHDLARQKELAQGIDQARALLESAVKDPSRAAKVLTDMEALLTRLDDLSRFDQEVVHVQGMAHTTSSLEKTSSEMQSVVIQMRSAASGSDANMSGTMSIIPALLVVVSGEICAFPIESVTEIVNVPKKDIYSVDGNTTMKLRDHALSLVELSSVIQAAPAAAAAEGAVRRVVVITDGTDKLGMIVDSLLGKDEIVLKSLTKHFAGVKGIVGASVLADGNVALILDPAIIIKESR